MQTWLALPDGKEEIDPAFEHVPGDGLPLVEGDGVSARVLMGTLVGQDRRDHRSMRATIYADIVLDAGASVPIDADADERAVMLVEGEANLDGQPLEPFALYVLAPGQPMTLDRDRDRAADAARRRGLRHPAPRVVELRLARRATGIDQAKEDWKARRFPLDPRRRARSTSRIPAVPKTVSYP